MKARQVERASAAQVRKDAGFVRPIAPSLTRLLPLLPFGLTERPTKKVTWPVSVVVPCGDKHIVPLKPTPLPPTKDAATGSLVVGAGGSDAIGELCATVVGRLVFWNATEDDGGTKVSALLARSLAVMLIVPLLMFSVSPAAGAAAGDQSLGLLAALAPPPTQVRVVD